MKLALAAWLMADISAAWLSERLPEKEILDVTLQDMSGAGGLNCLMVRFWGKKGVHGGPLVTQSHPKKVTSRHPI